jgi:hypothetical protein
MTAPEILFCLILAWLTAETLVADLLWSAIRRMWDEQ